MGEQTLEEKLGSRIKRGTEGKRGWLLGNYGMPFPNKLYAAAAAMTLDDAERTGKAYFSLQDFKVYVLRIMEANDSAEFFREEGISCSKDRMPLADTISQAKTELADAAAYNSELRGEKLEEAIILDVINLERLGGLKLRFAGGTIAVLAKQAFNYLVRTRDKDMLPYLDKQVRQEENRTISYKLVMQSQTKAAMEKMPN